jgi:hypothetical protein
MQWLDSMKFENKGVWGYSAKPKRRGRNWSLK